MSKRKSPRPIGSTEHEFGRNDKGNLHEGADLAVSSTTIRGSANCTKRLFRTKHEREPTIAPAAKAMLTHATAVIDAGRSIGPRADA